jgi:D-aminopeptidase
MRVYISVDREGIAAILHEDQTEATGPATSQIITGSAVS